MDNLTSKCYLICCCVGAFLVPYGVFAVLCGIPLFLLETAIGQYTHEGFVTCWTKLCPLARGEVMVVGKPFTEIQYFVIDNNDYLSVVINYHSHFYHVFAGIGYGQFVIKMFDFSFIIIQTWTLLYLVFSFRTQLPWVSCDNIWNTGNDRQTDMHNILIC